MNTFTVYGIILIYGVLIGSFLNVCIYRIPEGSSIVVGRSHCMNCNTPLKWYDMVPVISYLILRGRCRKCKAKISIQYPVIEALNGVFYVLIFYIYGWDSIEDIILSMASCFVISALIVLSVIDFRTNTIPVGINIFILFVGIITVMLQYFWFHCGLDVVIEHVIGFFAISIFLVIIFFATGGRGIGGGDIRLMAAAGLVLGWKNIILAFFLGCVLASIIHPIRMKIGHVTKVLAFGPYLSAGIVTALLYGGQIIDMYVRIFFCR